MATDGGRDVDFPIGHPKYLPPEVIVAGPKGGVGAGGGGGGGGGVGAEEEMYSVDLRDSAM